jgi:hypothetical protein
MTPSELVLLNGELFAQKAWIGNVRLLHAEAEVSATQLGRAMLAAAFLAADQAGSIHLEVRPKKAFLHKVDALFVDPGDPAIAWPEHSLENRLRTLAEACRSNRQDADVVNLVYRLLREDSANPWQSTVELVKEGLAARGLLAKVQVRKLKVFVSTHYELSESTAALRLGQSIEPVRQLLEECERDRPGVWRLLVAGINKAIKQRTEQQESGDD